MIVDVHTIPSLRYGMNRPRTAVELQCDVCGTTWGYTCSPRRIRQLRDVVTHVCTTGCARIARSSGGSIQKTMSSSCIKRFGVENPMQSHVVKMRVKETCIERYGVDNPAKAWETKKRATDTCAVNYGVAYPMQSDTVRERSRVTCLKRYGVDNPSKADIVKERRQRTCLERFGVRNVFCGGPIREGFNTTTSSMRRHMTMKRNGTYARQASSVEDRFFDVLVEYFERDNVVRHVKINGWCVDFYVPSIDLYVQFDGVYWHGLDRPIDVVRKFRHPRDRTIYATWLRDREQDVWFEENDLRLLRITDKDDPQTVSDKLLSANCLPTQGVS